MAPAYAVPRLLERAGLSLRDFDFIEVHEAFASQVLATLAAWEKRGPGNGRPLPPQRRGFLPRHRPPLRRHRRPHRGHPGHTPRGTRHPRPRPYLHLRGRWPGSHGHPGTPLTTAPCNHAGSELFEGRGNCAQPPPAGT